jgi:hypothetical protein
MSVAGPVVPTKEDGGVDQDRSEHIYYVSLYNLSTVLFYVLITI